MLGFRRRKANTMNLHVFPVIRIILFKRLFEDVGNVVVEKKLKKELKIELMSRQIIKKLIILIIGLRIFILFLFLKLSQRQ